MLPRVCKRAAAHRYVYIYIYIYIYSRQLFVCTTSLLLYAAVRLCVPLFLHLKIRLLKFFFPTLHSYGQARVQFRYLFFIFMLLNVGDRVVVVVLHMASGTAPSHSLESLFNMPPPTLDHVPVLAVDNQLIRCVCVRCASRARDDMPWRSVKYTKTLV